MDEPKPATKPKARDNSALEKGQLYVSLDGKCFTFDGQTWQRIKRPRGGLFFSIVVNLFYTLLVLLACGFIPYFGCRYLARVIFALSGHGVFG